MRDSPLQQDLVFSGQSSTTGLNDNPIYSPQDHGSMDFGQLTRMASSSSTGHHNFNNNQSIEGLNAMANITDASVDQSSTYIHEVHPNRTNDTAPGLSAGLEMVWSNWPSNVPEPELLRHL